MRIIVHPLHNWECHGFEFLVKCISLVCHRSESCHKFESLTIGMSWVRISCHEYDIGMKLYHRYVMGSNLLSRVHKSCHVGRYSWPFDPTTPQRVPTYLSWWTLWSQAATCAVITVSNNLQGIVFNPVGRGRSFVHSFVRPQITFAQATTMNRKAREHSSLGRLDSVVVKA